MKKNHFEIVRKSQIIATDSLMTLHAGEEVTVACSDFAPLSTVMSAVTRLNQRSGWKEFEASSPDNGATIYMKRNEQ